MSVCVSLMSECVCTEVEVDIGTFLQWSSLSLLRQGLSLKLELTRLAT